MNQLLSSLPRDVRRTIQKHKVNWSSLAPFAFLGRDKNVALVVGTRHNCPKSAARVRELGSTLGQAVKSVAVELCLSRLPSLGEKPKYTLDGVPFFGSTQKIARQKLSDQDMMQAILSALTESGASVYLIDQDINETKRRFYDALGMNQGAFSSMLASCGLSFESLVNICLAQEHLPSKATATLTPEVKTMLLKPSRVIKEERDAVLATNLFKVVPRGSLTLAVVGNAHLEGICKNWKDSHSGRILHYENRDLASHSK